MWSEYFTLFFFCFLIWLFLSFLSLEWVSECYVDSVVSDSLWPHGLYSASGSLVHGILQARILEGGHALLQGIFPNQTQVSCSSYIAGGISGGPYLTASDAYIFSWVGSLPFRFIRMTVFCFQSQAIRNLASPDGKDWKSVSLSGNLYLLSSMTKQPLGGPPTMTEPASLLSSPPHY